MNKSLQSFTTKDEVKYTKICGPGQKIPEKIPKTDEKLPGVF